VPLLVLVLASVAAGAAVALLARLWPRVDARRPGPLSRRARRLDPGAATGLALTLALAAIVLGGLVVGALALVIRGHTGATGLDASVARWANEHATPFTTRVLERFTNIGRPGTVIVLAVILGVVETIRTRSRWVAPFLFVVLAGNGLITTTIKHLADRVRPALNPAAAALGPSFPSGHSSWSAAFFAAAALVLGRHASRRTRVALAAVAAGLAVAVAASRVLLDVHWLTDVVAGLALGWAWFAVCAIAFGGRLLRFGATGEPALEPSDPAAPGSRGGRPTTATR
jgi:membrane-associated phospholipid phosphatase